MSEKKIIRIVKKGQNTRPPFEPKVNSAREAARDMVETITNWVTELQQKRGAEITNSLKILYKVHDPNSIPPRLTR